MQIPVVLGKGFPEFRWRGTCWSRVTIATAPNSEAMTELIGGLGPNGKLILIGVASDPIEVAPVQLIRGGKTMEGWEG